MPRQRSLRILPVGLIGALAALAAAHPAPACMIVGRSDNRSAGTLVAGEDVLIVWDPATHTEQLVRHLSFMAANGDFGFVVPTPARPKISEADDHLFSALFTVYQHRDNIPMNWETHRSRPGSVARAAPPPVEEVEHTRVSGLDATVLLASDADALTVWLDKHSYKTTAALIDYLRPYVDKHWYLTAFRYEGPKVAPGAAPSEQPLAVPPNPWNDGVFELPPPAAQPARGNLHTRSVRLTFHSPRPFFPYAEPTDSPKPVGRAFRITVIAQVRLRGELDDGPWAARADFSRPLSQAYTGRRFVFENPADGAAWEELVRTSPRGPWMSTFDERGVPRGQSDLFFVPDPDQSEVKTGYVDKIE